MNEELRKQIIAEVAEFTTAPRLEEDEFTARQYADVNGLAVKTARNQLNRQVKAGKLEARWIMHDQHRQRAYSLVGT